MSEIEAKREQLESATKISKVVAAVAIPIYLLTGVNAMFGILWQGSTLVMPLVSVALMLGSMPIMMRPARLKNELDALEGR